MTFLGLVPTVFAQCSPGSGGVDLGECLQLSDGTLVKEAYYNPAVLVNLLVRNLFVVAGVIFFLIIIFAGFKFIMGGKKGAEDAKNIIQTALVGFVIMFAAYWIIQIVSLLTGVDLPGSGA